MHVRAILSVLAFAIAPIAASAQTGPAQPVPEGDREGFMWLVQPSSLPYSMFFPADALMQGVVGRVVLECATRLDQRLDCHVAEEAPQGWGFGDAAIGVSRSFRALPAMRNGRLIAGSRARVPIRFLTMRDDDDGAREEGEPDLPAWEAAPNAAAVAAAWPEGQAQSNLRGRASLSCTVETNRTLDCSLVRESRDSLGLGRAALALSSQFRVAEHETDFIARHNEAPFVLAVNFGFAPLYEPLNVNIAGDAPLRFPPPPQQIVEAVYLRSARDAGLSGSAVITCTLSEEQTRLCALTHEDPPGQGFGDAALGLVQRAIAGLPLPDDMLAGDQVEFVVPFEASAARAR